MGSVEATDVGHATPSVTLNTSKKHPRRWQKKTYHIIQIVGQLPNRVVGVHEEVRRAPREQAQRAPPPPAAPAAPHAPAAQHVRLWNIMS